MRAILLSMFALLMASLMTGGVQAQESSLNNDTSSSTTTTTTSSSSNTGTATSYQAQQAAIQNQITQGITNGTLSNDQLEKLQAQQDRLTSARAAAAGGGVNGPSYDNTMGNTGRRPQTGPDSFTYNSLGPDAYQAQKNQNPQYNVPAYPTTNSTSLNTTQQYNTGTATGPASVTPQVGTYYGNNGVNGGSGVATVTPSGGGNGVYVYQPSMSRR